MERRYSSPLRERQQELTRNRIMQALVALITEGKIADFTVRDVAQRAGVSYGSVYRHYPTREALLTALHTWVNPGGPPPPKSLTDLPRAVQELTAYWDRYGEAVMAVSRALTALNVRPEGTRQRDEYVRSLVEEALPEADPAEVRRSAAILRHLTNAAAWTQLRQALGLSAEDATAAMVWATEVLTRELVQRRPPRRSTHEGEQQNRD